MEPILYLEVNLVCIAILFTVFIRDTQLRKNDTYHILFTRVLFSNILFFVADIAWGLMALSSDAHIVGNWIVNIIYFSMSGVAAYFWLVFVEKMIDQKSIEKPLGKILSMLPATVLIVLSILSIKTHWLFFIDASGQYQRGELYILQPILAYILPVYATLRAVYAMRRSKNFEKRRQYLSLALFYVLPAIGGICQVLLKGTPMLNIGIALSGLWVYFTFQDNVIMLDSLTTMNNRRSFDKNMEIKIHSFDPASGNHLWLIIADVDYFKKINDGFGHAEGDKALITIANVLKDLSGQFNCLAARIGGDEFTLCCMSDDETYPKQICEVIQNRLSEASRTYPFRIKLSMGCAEYKAGMTPQQLFIAADKELYEAKKSRELLIG